MSTQTNLIDWVENASPEQLALIESVGPDNIVRMREELQQLRAGQADKNRALLKEFLDDHRTTIGLVVGVPVVVLFSIALFLSLYYLGTGSSREYRYSLDKVVECRKDMVSKGVDLDQVCGKIPPSPFNKP